VAITIAVLVLATPPAARALALPCECSAFGSSGLILLRSAKPQTRGVLAVSLAAHHYESYDLSDCLGTSTPGVYTSLHLAGNYGMTDWLEFSFDVPARRASWDGTTGGSRTVTGLDNPVAAAKVGTPVSSTWHLGLETRFGLPLGGELYLDNTCDGRTYITGGKKTDWEIIALASGDFTDRFPLRIHANAGWAFHTNELDGRRYFPDYYPPVNEGGSRYTNDLLILRCAFEFPGRDVSLFTEFRGDLFLNSDHIALKESPLSITPGVRFRFGGWSATAGLTVALSGDDAGTPNFDPHEAYPDWEITASLAYSWPIMAADTDGDGIPDHSDACVRQAEDFDGFEDGDGCPDPDNDGDGVPDEYDGEPLLAEDLDGFEDGDGVPDLDNDGDGIVDERDMCPNEREDLDGFEDQDGCPDR